MSATSVKINGSIAANARCFNSWSGILLVLQLIRHCLRLRSKEPAGVDLRMEIRGKGDFDIFESFL